MTKIALAGINSFALWPIGHVLDGRISFGLHELTDRVAIFEGRNTQLNASLK